MLIEGYELDVFTPPCEPGAERFSAIAKLRNDIREVFPYLNSVLRGAVYEPNVPSVSWRKAGHYVVFHPNQIAVSNVEDRDKAIKEVEGLIELVNKIWEQRHEIKPSYETRRRPGPMEVYKLLPGTNCKACGQPTCFVFATKLVAGQVKLDDCPVLKEPEYSERKEKLLDLIPEDMPALGPKET